MENILSLNYDLYIDEIKKINNDYYFLYKKENSVLRRYNRNIEDIEEIYDLNNHLSYYIPTYKIILTKHNTLLVEYQNDYYVLMKIPNIKNRIISYEDVLKFNIEINKEYKFLDRTNWALFWSKKIDYIEYQFYQIQNKHKIINEDINYYIGLWENAISYFNNATIGKKYLSIRRININTDLLQLLDPLEFILDSRERLLGDYIKSFILNNNYTEDRLDTILQKTNLTRNGVILLITRILFPSYYFDIYEDIIENNIEESKIQNIKSKNIITTINLIYKKFSDYNIPKINWIKKEEY